MSRTVSDLHTDKAWLINTGRRQSVIRRCGRWMWVIDRRGGFIRCGDKGLRLVNHKECPPLYSERMNTRDRRYWHFGSWCLATLAPKP